MENGNEGDEIILLSLRQINCPIPDSILTVGDITADLFVEIIVRSLFLISNGDVKFPMTLPPNIASRHRICTAIATKIKELGFLGDCGYNQLLYPVANQTRGLLTWLVDKLPRSEEEGAQEVLGASALMNKRIKESLLRWKSSTWRLPFCSSGAVLSNVYSHRSFQTIPKLLERQPEFTTVEIYQKTHELDIPLEPSIFERHALELIYDSTLAFRLESGFDDEVDEAADTEDSDELVQGTDKQSCAEAKSSSSRPSALKSAVHLALRTAVERESRTEPGTASGGDSSATVTTPDGALSSGSRCAQTKQLSVSLQDLVQGISDEYNASAAAGRDGSTNKGTDRGSRFAHAVAFGQETSAAVSIAATADSMPALTSTTSAANVTQSPSVSSDGLKSSGGNDTGGDVDPSAEHNAAAVAAASAAKNATTSRAAARRAQLEQEEQDRQKELDELRREVQQYSATVETMVRNHAQSTVRTKQYENDIAEFVAETERMEKEVMVKRKTLEMLPSAADSIAKLQELCNGGSERLLQLAQEWDTHRLPLVEQLRAMEELQVSRREKGRQMVEEIRRYRQDMITMIQDLKDKQDRSAILADEMSRLSKNVNRTMYTHRIMDITASIVKQNKDIDKITSDIRDIQKTINLSSNTLQRADAIAEELIYAAANDRNDPVMVDTYRRLKTMRTKFDELVSSVNRIGQQDKALRDLETKIDQERARISANNLDRIQEDLTAIAAENAQLVAQVKAAGAAKRK